MKHDSKLTSEEVMMREYAKGMEESYKIKNMRIYPYKRIR
jgi:hypothetical protein